MFVLSVKNWFDFSPMRRIGTLFQNCEESLPIPYTCEELVLNFHKCEESVPNPNTCDKWVQDAHTCEKFGTKLSHILNY